MPELNRLLRDLHGDLLALGKTQNLLASYSPENLHYHGGIAWISYYPTLGGDGGIAESPVDRRAQQPRHLSIGYMPLGERWVKYSNSVEEEESGKFPLFGCGIYAEILLGENELESRIKTLLLNRCREWQERIKASGLSLAEDLPAEDFQKALIGKWDSVHARDASGYVREALFREDGTAEIQVWQKGPTAHQGTYTIAYLRELRKERVTLADIAISGNEPISLRRVNFGYHNAVPQSHGLLLRIDGEPSGVLRKSVVLMDWPAAPYPGEPATVCLPELVPLWKKQREHFRQSGYVYLEWESARNLLLDGACNGGKQLHTGWLSMVTRDGRTYATVQPALDEYLRLAEDYGVSTGGIGTE